MASVLPYRPYCYYSLEHGPITVGGGVSYSVHVCHLELNVLGPSRPNITIFFTILAVAVSFAWLGVDDPSQWRAGIALYILGRE